MPDYAASTSGSTQNKGSTLINLAVGDYLTFRMHNVAGNTATVSTTAGSWGSINLEN